MKDKHVAFTVSAAIIALATSVALFVALKLSKAELQQADAEVLGPRPPYCNGVFSAWTSEACAAPSLLQLLATVFVVLMLASVLYKLDPRGQQDE